jgi:uncharacterized protein YhfF
MPNRLSLEQHLQTLGACGITIPDGPVQLAHYGDTPELSDELIRLIACGQKRATSSLLWSWTAENATLPAPGDIDLVLDHHDDPVLFTRVLQVHICPFNAVDADFAAREGEGDLSLAWWRTEHQRFFTAECERIGRMPSSSMPCVCVSFDLLYLITASGNG